MHRATFFLRLCNPWASVQLTIILINPYSECSTTSVDLDVPDGLLIPQQRSGVIPSLTETLDELDVEKDASGRNALWHCMLKYCNTVT
jgi:hypothetical protein